MPAVRHELLSIYQMAWVKSGKDEQGRRLLVTTMLHPMKILVPHRITSPQVREVADCGVRLEG